MPEKNLGGVPEEDLAVPHIPRADLMPSHNPQQVLFQQGLGFALSDEPRPLDANDAGDFGPAGI